MTVKTWGSAVNKKTCSKVILLSKFHGRTFHCTVVCCVCFARAALPFCAWCRRPNWSPSRRLLDRTGNRTCCWAWTANWSRPWGKRPSASFWAVCRWENSVLQHREFLLPIQTDFSFHFYKITLKFRFQILKKIFLTLNFCSKFSTSQWGKIYILRITPISGGPYPPPPPIVRFSNGSRPLLICSVRFWETPHLVLRNMFMLPYIVFLSSNFPIESLFRCVHMLKCDPIYTFCPFCWVRNIHFLRLWSGDPFVLFAAVQVHRPKGAGLRNDDRVHRVSPPANGGTLEVACHRGRTSSSEKSVSAMFFSRPQMASALETFSKGNALGHGCVLIPACYCVHLNSLVQPNTKLVNGSVSLTSYPASPDGMIKSFQERYEKPEFLEEALLECARRDAVHFRDVLWFFFPSPPPPPPFIKMFRVVRVFVAARGQSNRSMSAFHKRWHCIVATLDYLFDPPGIDWSHVHPLVDWMERVPHKRLSVFGEKHPSSKLPIILSAPHCRTVGKLRNILRLKSIATHKIGQFFLGFVGPGNIIPLNNHARNCAPPSGPVRESNRFQGNVVKPRLAVRPFSLSTSTCEILNSQFSITCLLFHFCSVF